jgi:hypothetical protein
MRLFDPTINQSELYIELVRFFLNADYLAGWKPAPLYENAAKVGRASSLPRFKMKTHKSS